jgi:5-methylcytosine-specific restriction protein A
MKTAVQTVFRRLTAADFFNINKPKGMEARGGGQSYIDFPTSAVTPANWASFFAGQKAAMTHSGPLWRFTVHSIALGKSQVAEIGRRRTASYNIRAQKLDTKNSNRLYAWHPQYSGFPRPADPSKRQGVKNLVIYLIRTSEGEYWAGWFQRGKPDSGWEVDPRLRRMFTAHDGYINLDPGAPFDETEGQWPFRPSATSTATVAAAGAAAVSAKKLAPAATRGTVGGTSVPTPSKKPPTPYRQKTEEEVAEDLFADDVPADITPEQRQVVVNILKRNQKIVGKLKDLYGGQCQLTGDKFTFKKKNGVLYSEAHHLIPLGGGGADSPYNIIVVSPLIHRMLHYADVSGLDLGKIVANKLEIEINGVSFAITWHPKHAELVSAAAKNLAE